MNSNPGRRAVAQGIAGIGGLLLLSACGIVPPWLERKSRVPRVAYLSTVSSAADYNGLFEALRGGFRDLGYQVDTDLVVDYSSAEGHVERLPMLVQQLLQVPVDVLVPSASPAAVAAKAATTMTPIVFVNVNDPVGQGLVASLARPGGNVTGVSTLSGALSSKRVGLLKETLPELTRLSVLWNAANPGMALAFSQTREAASALGIKVLSHGVRTNEEVPGALDDIARVRPDALIVLPSLDPSPITLVPEFGASHGLPVMYSDRSGADAGGLMALGPNYPQLHRRAAWLVDRILKGTTPADLAVEQPTQFDFVLNFKAAEALDLSIPQSVLLQATDVVR